MNNNSWILLDELLQGFLTAQSIPLNQSQLCPIRYDGPIYRRGYIYFTEDNWQFFEQSKFACCQQCCIVSYNLRAGQRTRFGSLFFWGTQCAQLLEPISPESEP